ncbi:MAG: hypothetical protein EOP31_11480 [Rhodococcus sp. (in: high G+C Gram-positive bacteria)]|uniref:class I adenylate-forming enzyme family protein n=2 Tax=unclassified Rhodococcus (in: high G+C Gram-positive bacteria) TaxID=192944 RepID=UPI0012138D14|nr:AMP-binding protein [Rhodococcus sp. (in: high G+C Gram-positive bacteria)]RZL24925.1 MAG: hypothetical protein EOP31_11480 [Rhodococcus sp. (in: high G+C Gram-positive bacteria)]
MVNTLDMREILVSANRAFPDRVAFSHGARSLTYGQLFERSCRLANGLAELGIKKGDRVAAVGPNGVEMAEHIAGLALGGFVRSSLYTHMPAASNADIVRRIGARVLLVHQSWLDLLLPLTSDMPSIEHIIVYGGELVPSQCLQYEDLLAAASTSDPAVVLDRSDPHVLRFSAGTTGTPKAVLHTVGAFYDLCNELWQAMTPPDEPDTYLAVGPLTHVAVSAFWPNLEYGGRTVMIDEFEAGSILRLIEEERVTVTTAVPLMVNRLATHPDVESKDLSSLRCVLYAGAPITEKELRHALRTLGPVLFGLYAQSEAAPISVLKQREHLPNGTPREQKRLMSVGRAVPGAKIWIVDSDGNEVPSGEPGEVLVQTPGAFKEFWEEPEMTKARRTDDGKVFTRDIGYLDEDGYLFLVDRSEDLIISGGFNIWPAEVEKVLRAHDDVRDACVFGIPSEKWGESPHAVVVLRSNATVTRDELIELTSRELGSVKKLASLEFHEELPYSPTGKLLRRRLRDLHPEN